MNPNRFLEVARSNKVIAIVRSDDAAQARRTVQRLIQRGMPLIELTMTTPGAIDILRMVKAAGGVSAVGMGTVLSAASAREAVDGGADFIVSPIFDPAVVEETRSHGRTMVAGALTPSEVQQAHQAGSDLIKVFPAGDLGIGYFSSLRSVFPRIPMIPTGSIVVADVERFLGAGAWAVGLGGALTRGSAEEMDARVAFLRSLASG